MSHTTTIDMKFKDPEAFAQAATDLGHEVMHNADVELYDGSKYTGVTAVKLPGWNYPVVLDGEDIRFDNYNGAWGEQARLDELQQRYARNVSVKEARKKGYRVQEKKTADGKIKLVLTR